MFREYFIAAQDFLRQQGLRPLLRQGEPVSEADIDAIDQRTDYPMPPHLRRFYIEMGNGFEFLPNDVQDSPLEGWERNSLDDYAIWNKGFHTAIEEEVSCEIASGRPRVDPELLREVAERRKRWIPFYGFVGGGDVLCLDSQGKVQFYQAMDWTTLPEFCRGFVLAESFADFVARWSKYSFVAPGCCWTSFCWNQSGVFDWSPSRFPLGILRANLGPAS
jgi:hypothetical protein